MKKWIILSLIHILGSLVNAFLEHCFFTASIYSSYPLLQKIVDGPHTVLIYDIIMYTIFVLVGILAVIFIKLPKSKFRLPKLLLTFCISCFISYVLFLIVLYASFAIIFINGGVY